MIYQNRSFSGSQNRLIYNQFCNKLKLEQYITTTIIRILETIFFLLGSPKKHICTQKLKEKNDLFKTNSCTKR